MITATKNEKNTNQISEMESGFSVSANERKMIKLNRFGNKYLTIYGVRPTLIEKLISNKTKKTQSLFIDSLLYLSLLKMPNDRLGLVDEFEDYSHPELELDIKIPHTLKDLFSRRRMIEIEEYIGTANNDLMKVELQYRSAKAIKLLSEGSFYTIGQEYADLIDKRMSDLRQKQCNKLPFNSTGFVIDVKTGEKNYLKRLLLEHDRNTIEGKNKIRDGIKRMKGLRNKVSVFNRVNTNLNGNNIPDVKQFYTKGRLYSFVTEIPREYRSAMYYVNSDNQIEDIVELDIKASHTNFLPTVLQIMLGSFDKISENSNIDKILTAYEINRYVEKLKALKVISSDLYTEIANDMKTTRNEIKGQWQEYVNDRKKAYKHKPNNVYKWFQIKFPNMASFIDICHKIECKNTSKSGWRNNIGYEFSIPLKLHSLENTLLVRPVVEKYKNIASLSASQSTSIITVHDSFLVPLSCIKTLKNILESMIKSDSLLSFIQIKSSNIKIKDLNLTIHMRTGCVLNATNENEIETSNASGGEPCADTVTLKTRKKISEIKNFRVGYSVSVKGKNYFSQVKMNESREQFRQRIIKELGLSEGDIK